ncbi:MAG: ester cyclase [Flammeovirgaceae bacterium]|nr:ester cyclase [Flammeovirgaceae bacterium]
MDLLKKNKQFMIRYVNALSSCKNRTREILEQWITDEKLIQHILFFDSVFPGYTAVIEEMTAEGNKVTMKMRMKCKHEGYLNDIPPTHREFEVSAVAGYEIENEKIVRTWLVSDQLNLMKLLGLEKESA